MEVPLLMTPGPCPVFQEVYDVYKEKIRHHRTQEFVDVYLRATANMKKVFETKGHVFLISASGTGGMEAAIANTVSPGDKVLSVACGVFGSRFHKIAKRFGAKTECMEVEWGKGTDPQAVKQAVDNFKPDITTLTFNETSTGITNPIGEIAELIGDETTLLVDGISGIGGIKYEHDNWGIGISVAGSQKAVAVPPGLAMVAVSDSMWERIEACTTPRFYFDLVAYRDSLEKRPPPYTPAIYLVRGLDAALTKLLETGLDEVYSQQEQIAKAVQAGVSAMGLEFFAEEKYRSNVLTSINSPIDANAVRKTMLEKYNVMVAGGQKQLKGKILRIGHMGAISNEDVYTTLMALQKALADNGHESKDPVPAAREVLG